MAIKIANIAPSVKSPKTRIVAEKSPIKAPTIHLDSSSFGAETGSVAMKTEAKSKPPVKTAA